MRITDFTFMVIRALILSWAHSNRMLSWILSSHFTKL